MQQKALVHLGLGPKLGQLLLLREQSLPVPLPSRPVPHVLGLETLQLARKPAISAFYMNLTLVGADNKIIVGSPAISQ